ncbi:hypothetical protein RSOL_125560 [Rhizoctonia solani AG-3 Rhs1AP]|uniref:C2H2-type domain-containing protein n=1 Tax=Rhizoctonia solani AG-3 Rhs1AP TaxID=1086054 RepID=X8J290_9AGAM|nr:hypothetical protein RSOL_125560 [Rhizoctonia solani AG-3 Rhs1AP]
MVVFITRRLVGSTDPEESYGDDNIGNLDNEHEVEPVEDWGEYGDHEVWVAARKMLANMPRRSHKEIEQQEVKRTSRDSSTLISRDVEQNEAKSSVSEVNPPEAPEKGDQGFVLEQVHADILLKGRVYFLHYPSVYCYDENRIICSIGEGLRYHQVTTIVPNPPELQAPFDIGGVAYCFGEEGALWYAMGEHWLLEVTFPALEPALSELVRYIEANNLHITADSIYTPPSSGPSQSTSSETGMQDTNMDAPEDGLRILSPSPDQEEIDGWMEHLKWRRAMQVKDGIRVSPIHCPVPACGKFQRRPQALRDHLYFHFNIKPHRCDYGCPIGFETEANKNRHLETCPMVPVWD